MAVSAVRPEHIQQWFGYEKPDRLPPSAPGKSLTRSIACVCLTRLGNRMGETANTPLTMGTRSAGLRSRGGQYHPPLLQPQTSQSSPWKGVPGSSRWFSQDTEDRAQR